MKGISDRHPCCMARINGLFFIPKLRSTSIDQKNNKKTIKCPSLRSLQLFTTAILDKHRNMTYAFYNDINTFRMPRTS